MKDVIEIQMDEELYAKVMDFLSNDSGGGIFEYTFEVPCSALTIDGLEFSGKTTYATVNGDYSKVVAKLAEICQKYGTTSDNLTWVIEEDELAKVANITMNEHKIAYLEYYANVNYLWGSVYGLPLTAHADNSIQIWPDYIYTQFHLDAFPQCDANDIPFEGGGGI